MLDKHKQQLDNLVTNLSGQYIAFIGPMFVGKSQFLRLLNGLDIYLQDQIKTRQLFERLEETIPDGNEGRPHNPYWLDFCELKSTIQDERYDQVSLEGRTVLTEREKDFIDNIETGFMEESLGYIEGIQEGAPISLIDRTPWEHLKVFLYFFREYFDIEGFEMRYIERINSLPSPALVMDIRVLDTQTQIDRQPWRSSGEEYDIFFYQEMEQDYEREIYPLFEAMGIPLRTVYTDDPDANNGSLEGQHKLLSLFFEGLREAGFWEGNHEEMLDYILLEQEIDLLKYESQVK